VAGYLSFAQVKISLENIEILWDPKPSKLQSYVYLIVVDDQETLKKIIILVASASGRYIIDMDSGKFEESGYAVPVSEGALDPSALGPRDPGVDYHACQSTGDSILATL
jgi:hypothetical protein